MSKRDYQGLDMKDFLRTSQHFSSIVTIDSASNEAFSFRHNAATPYPLKHASSSSPLFASYMYAKEVIATTVKMSRSIPDTDLQSAVEIKAYEELGLDTASPYKITFFEAPSNDTQQRHLHLFALNTERIHAQFEQTRHHVKYIDYLTTAPFLFHGLYKKHILDTKHVDCFVYLQHDDAFVTLYQYGHYVYTKSLRYSLHEMSEKFCELLGERIDEEDFYRLLTTEAITSEESRYAPFLSQLLSELFLYINDVLIFAKRSFGIENIDRFYFDTQLGPVPKSDEYVVSHTGLTPNTFAFVQKSGIKNCPTDPMHWLLYLNAQVYLESPDEVQNVTIFKRPPAFSKRPVGKLAGALVASALLTSAYPTLQIVQGFQLKLETTDKKKLFRSLHQKTQEIKKTLDALKAKKESIETKLAFEMEKLQFRKKLLEEIHDKKMRSPMKSVMLHSLAQLINQRGIHIQKIKEDETQMTLSLVSQSDKKLTELLRDIANQGQYAVSAKEIRQDKAARYISDITIKVP